MYHRHGSWDIITESIPCIAKQPNTMDKPHFTIDHLTDNLFRHESGKIIAVLIKIFGFKQFEIAEDIVQESFVRAIQNWRLNGVPDNPAAWLMKVAKNLAIDQLRKKKHTIDLDISEQEKTLLESGYTFVPAFEKIWDQIIIEDELLQMMFACCHDGISAEHQITLMLKTLCGFSTLEVAKAFLTTEEAISKRLYRTKEFFRTQQIKPGLIDPSKYDDRLDAVLKAIYLIFNEGYLSTHSDQSIRKDLIHQALYLGSILSEHPKTNTSKVLAALALMCFHASRIASRLDDAGDIILLAQQDRSLWDHQLITKGMIYLDQSAQGDEITTYHLEAAIAQEHCMASSYEATDWKKILQLYDWLESIQPNPIVVLNRMVAFSKCHDIEESLEAIQTSPFLSSWQVQPVYHALLGDLYAHQDPPRARLCYLQAVTHTHSEAEKKLMHKKIAGLKLISEK